MILSDIAVNILAGCRALASVVCCKIVRGGRDGFLQGDSHRVLRGSSIPYNGSYVVTLYLTRPFTRRVLNY